MENMKKNDVEIFRCDETFRANLVRCAKRLNLDKSSYIRMAVITANRRINSHGTGVKQS